MAWPTAVAVNTGTCRARRTAAGPAAGGTRGLSADAGDGGGRRRPAREGGLTYEGEFRLAALADNDIERRGRGGRKPTGRVIAGGVSGSFSVDHQALRSDDFRLETGPLDDPYTGGRQRHGVTRRKRPASRIMAEGVQLRVDEAAGGAVSLEDRPGGGAALPRPGAQAETIPGTVELDLPAVIDGDTTIREVRLRAEPSEAGWRIAALNATLPGRTALEASGELSVGEESAFSGSWLLAINQPSGLGDLGFRVTSTRRIRRPAGRRFQPRRGRARRAAPGVFRHGAGVGDLRIPRGEIDKPPAGRPHGRSMALSPRRRRGWDSTGMSAFASPSSAGRARRGSR